MAETKLMKFGMLALSVMVIIGINALLGNPAGRIGTAINKMTFGRLTK